ncbi:MAG: 30S ribosomal protein S5 [Patescibacteria group bacterium]|jgi:small subunit ribosomal protein S5
MVDNTTNLDAANQPARATKNFMRPRKYEGEKRDSEFEERVIEVRRVARTVKGGRRIRFRALVVIGNKKGKVGAGIGKANDVSEAVKKAVVAAKKDMIIVPIINGTIPYEMTTKFASAVVMLRPATSGTSIVAGGSVRAVAELAGITDLLSKMMGSPNKLNNVMATLKAFSSFDASYTKIITDRSEAKKKLIEAQDVKIKPLEVVAEAPVEEEKKAVKKTTKKAAKKSMK